MWRSLVGALALAGWIIPASTAGAVTVTYALTGIVTVTAPAVLAGMIQPASASAPTRDLHIGFSPGPPDQLRHPFARSHGCLSAARAAAGRIGVDSRRAAALGIGGKGTRRPAARAGEVAGMARINGTTGRRDRSGVPPAAGAGSGEALTG